jgi:type I restriction enzyme, S subunit
MNPKWQPVRLGEVLLHRKEFITIEDLTTYKRPRVQLHAKGVVLRDEVPGGMIKTKTQQVCRTGEFLVAEIDAKVGGFGVVPRALNGSIVSSHYFLFVIDETRLCRQFLNYFIRTPAFHEQVAAQGSTNYAAIRPMHVLRYEIPLPPLAEQQRVVARIEELALQVQEAHLFREQAAEQAEALFNSFLTAIFDSSDWPLKPLPEVAAVARGKFAHRPRNEPRFYGGHTPFIQIGDISNANRYIRTYTQTLNEEGLAISRMFPRGTVAIAITGATIGVTGILTFDSCFPDSIVGIQAKPGLATNEFIYLAVEHAKKTALAEATQTTQPNINLGNLQRLNVHVPSISEQRQIVCEFEELQAEVDALKLLQFETAAELDALLPSILSKAFSGNL